MPVGRGLFGGSPYLGVYLRVTESAMFGPPTTPPGLARDIARLLGVRIVETTVLDSEVVGALLAANSQGAVLGDFPDEGERAALEQIAPVTVVKTRQNALGNNVLANDSGALVHPELPDHAVAAIGEALRVPARRGTIAGLGTVGTAGIATNRGVVLHPKVTDREAGVIRELLGVPVHRSTANFGVPVVGACLVANSRGIVVGKPTTPVEIVHLQDGLAVLD